jgi:hypothetical protein
MEPAPTEKSRDGGRRPTEHGGSSPDPDPSEGVSHGTTPISIQAGAEEAASRRRPTEQANGGRTHIG